MDTDTPNLEENVLVSLVASTIRAAQCWIDNCLAQNLLRWPHPWLSWIYNGFTDAQSKQFMHPREWCLHPEVIAQIGGKFDVVQDLWTVLTEHIVDCGPAWHSCKACWDRMSWPTNDLTIYNCLKTSLELFLFLWQWGVWVKACVKISQWYGQIRWSMEGGSDGEKPIIFHLDYKKKSFCTR